jgi:hypothetical protein
MIDKYLDDTKQFQLNSLKQLHDKALLIKE